MCADPLPFLASDPLRQAGFRWAKARRERLTVEAHLESEGEQLQVDVLIETERLAAMDLIDLLMQELGFVNWLGGRIEDDWHPDDRVALTPDPQPPTVAEAVTAIDLDTN